MPKTIHMGLDVRGAIRNLAWRTDLVGYCSDPETGRQLTSDEILDVLLDHVAAGHRVIPMCSAEECPDFDYEDGCPGHDIPAACPGCGEPPMECACMDCRAVPH